jgi:hypothetical protein
MPYYNLRYWNGWPAPTRTVRLETPKRVAQSKLSSVPTPLYRASGACRGNPETKTKQPRIAALTTVRREQETKNPLHSVPHS